MDWAEENSPATTAWENLASALRRAFHLHHQGREDEALRAAQEELPLFIQRWTEASTEQSAWKRRRLIGLILEESQRLGEPVLLRQMLMGRFASATHAMAGARAALIGHGPLGGGISRLSLDDWHPSPTAHGGEGEEATLT